MLGMDEEKAEHTWGGFCVLVSCDCSSRLMAREREKGEPKPPDWKEQTTAALGPVRSKDLRLRQLTMHLVIRIRVRG